MRQGRQHLRGLASVAVVGLALTACGSDSAAPEASSGADGEITGPEVTLTLGHPFPASHLIQTGAMDPFIE
jgi:ABC-type glycerol-3-phosphate transport system substrate-binding protein